MANGIQTKLGCSTFFFIALLCMLSEKTVDGRRMSSMKNRELVPRKGTIKTIESEDGDIIDCVDIYQQPSLDHPALKNHTIEMQPPSIPKPKFFQVNKSFQTWRKNGDCPERTVPIIRKSKKLTMTKEHEYAQITSFSGHYYGLEADLNVWHPNVTSTGEFSTSQVWISSSVPLVNSSTMEAGWMVVPGDTGSRLFIYSTQDGYKTGCLNAACGFVQVSAGIAPGASIGPISYYSGNQYEYYMSIMKHPDTHWWLMCSDGAVGYWPVDIFKEFGDYATHINFGGKIYNSEPGGIHTSTQMGSGHFPSDGFGKACFIRNIRYFDENRTSVTPDPKAFQQLVKKPMCYGLNLSPAENDNVEAHIFFGGPGYSNTCPN